jgi:hypothetical protein
MNKSHKQFMVTFPNWGDGDLEIFNQGLDSLTYEDVDTLAAWCDRARQHGGERSVASDLKRNAERKKSEERSKRRHQLEASRAPKIVAWLKINLKPGMKLQMKGCRDGHGIREFIRWHNGNLVCWQVFEERAQQQVTTHMPDKVVKVWTEPCRVPVSMIDLIK